MEATTIFVITIQPLTVAAGWMDGPFRWESSKRKKKMSRFPKCKRNDNSQTGII